MEKKPPKLGDTVFTDFPLISADSHLLSHTNSFDDSVTLVTPFSTRSPEAEPLRLKPPYTTGKDTETTLSATPTPL